MVRRLRLISGFILFTYVLAHLVNHGLGIVSIAAMETMLRVVYPIWSYPPVTSLLYGALIVHVTLALYAVWQRRLLKLLTAEAVQYDSRVHCPLAPCGACD
jgi:adenylate cyclase